MSGYQIGQLTAIICTPILFITIIGVVQFIRTRDKKLALKTAISWWAIVIAILCTLIGLIGQFFAQYR